MTDKAVGKEVTMTEQEMRKEAFRAWFAAEPESCKPVFEEALDGWLAACAWMAERQWWRPISEAPRDGDFLALTKQHLILVARWLSPEHPDAEPDEPGNFANAWSNEYIDEPTHWMPLPKPPAATEGSER